MELKSKGVTILLISHNFEQVLRLVRPGQVMRAGRTRRRRRTAETDGQELVGLVTGAILDPATDPEAPAASASEASSNDGVRQMTNRSASTRSCGAARGTSRRRTARDLLGRGRRLRPDRGADPRPVRHRHRDDPRLLDEYGLASACSMGLPPHADVASEDISVQAEGKKLLSRAVEVAEELGAQALCGVLYSAPRPSTPAR